MNLWTFRLNINEDNTSSLCFPLKAILYALFELLVGRLVLLSTLQILVSFLAMWHACLSHPRERRASTEQLHLELHTQASARLAGVLESATPFQVSWVWIEHQQEPWHALDSALNRNKTSGQCQIICHYKLLVSKPDIYCYWSAWS